MTTSESRQLTERVHPDAVAGLDARGVVKRYGERLALDGVDVRIDRGEVLALLGRNGAGKTTFASVVAGLRAPDAGAVVVDGVDVQRDVWRARARLGYAAQEVELYPSLTTEDNLRFFGRLADVSASHLRARMAELVDVLELAPYLHTPTRFLSGGERRRVHVAAALLHRPSLLVLDEPTAGVDVGSREAIIDLVKRARDDETAVCYSTHYLAEVENLGGSVAVLDHGRVAAWGPLAEVVRRHGDPFVELSFDGDAPALSTGTRTEVDGDTVRVYGDDPQLPAAVVAALGADTARLRLLRVVEPNLEAAFLALTGGRPAPTSEEDDS